METLATLSPSVSGKGSPPLPKGPSSATMQVPHHPLPEDPTLATYSATYTGYRALPRSHGIVMAWKRGPSHVMFQHDILPTLHHDCPLLIGPPTPQLREAVV